MHTVGHTFHLVAIDASTEFHIAVGPDQGHLHEVVADCTTLHPGTSQHDNRCGFQDALVHSLVLWLFGDAYCWFCCGCVWDYNTHAGGRKGVGLWWREGCLYKDVIAEDGVVRGHGCVYILGW